MLFTALSNQFFSADLGQPMANLPVTIFKFAMSPFANWQQLAWAGVFLITLGVLALNIAGARAVPAEIDERPMDIVRRIASLANERVKMDVQNLNFYYGKFQALKNISLKVPEKKVTAFIGPSGCGKSTLLRVFNRMYELYPEQRAEGEVNVDGENILTTKEDVALIRAKIGMIFQKPTPFPMSIYDNIAFGVRLFERMSRSAMDDRVEWALRKAALWNEVKDKLNQTGTGLSGGQQQRLCIARGIAVRPEVILFDEPCSALDPISTAKIEELIDELKNDYTVAIVTHNMQQAARVSDYTAYMYLGRADRIRRHRPDLREAGAQGNRGLHHRPFRLSRGRHDAPASIRCGSTTRNSRPCGPACCTWAASSSPRCARR